VVGVQDFERVNKLVAKTMEEVLIRKPDL